MKGQQSRRKAKQRTQSCPGRGAKHDGLVVGFNSRLQSFERPCDSAGDSAIGGVEAKRWVRREVGGLFVSRKCFRGKLGRRQGLEAAGGARRPADHLSVGKWKLIAQARMRRDTGAAGLYAGESVGWFWVVCSEGE